ncbi:MAG: nucleotidyltransferase domain-containing protein [Gammaproteobacteria bacterium]|jgi:predicted nucleotidyltransferase|nr:nucleotidyltransferase domain-containing protein [Gammaproteobacteria bacterium]
MRLAEDEITAIRSAVAVHFGAGSAVWVFGSQLDDAARGGDVDLYVEPAPALPGNLFLAQQALRSELERRLKRPVDVVVQRDVPTAFMRQARAEGERL